MVILDEADRMLDMGFVDDIKTILREVPDERQTVFFSATIPRPIQELIKTFTRNPVNVRVEAEAMTVPAIEQIYYEVDRRSKLEVLCRLHRPRGCEAGDHFLRDQDDGGRTDGAPDRARLQRGQAARRHDAGDAGAGDGEVPQARDRDSGRDRCGGARARCGRHRGGVQLRPAARRRRLRPSDRPHGTRGAKAARR